MTDEIRQLEKRVKEIEEWKSNIEGRIFATSVIFAAIWSLVITILLFIFKK